MIFPLMRIRSAESVLGGEEVCAEQIETANSRATALKTLERMKGIRARGIARMEFRLRRLHLLPPACTGAIAHPRRGHRRTTGRTSRNAQCLRDCRVRLSEKLPDRCGPSRFPAQLDSWPDFPCFAGDSTTSGALQRRNHVGNGIGKVYPAIEVGL